MEISHDKEADDSDNDTYEFDFLIRGDATGKVVRDFLIKDGNTSTGNQNHNAGKKPSNAKIPVHISIIHLIF